MSLTAAGVCVLLLSAAAADAQESEDSPAIAEARQRFELAEGHYDRGEHALALAEFERVLALMEGEGHPNAALVLYNIGVVNQQMNRERAALDAFERFLAEAPTDAEHRADAQRIALELRERLALRAADSREDGGRETDEEVSTAAPSEVDEFRPSPIGIGIAAVGGAAMIAGAILGGVALSEGDAARADCVESRCPAVAESGIADAQLLANVSDGLLFGGLAVLTAGIVLTIVLGESEEVSASVACSGGGGSVTLSGEF